MMFSRFGPLFDLHFLAALPPVVWLVQQAELVVVATASTRVSTSSKHTLELEETKSRVSELDIFIFPLPSYQDSAVVATRTGNSKVSWHPFVHILATK
mmetsp:Transcript_15846/g.24116  ORF Transcript_15846/g.24116 Transcript_15846/m.24116 type:complete len:98 (-) Transcript_15846:225-518(-)